MGTLWNNVLTFLSGGTLLAKNDPKIDAITEMLKSLQTEVQQIRESTHVLDPQSGIVGQMLKSLVTESRHAHSAARDFDAASRNFHAASRETDAALIGTTHGFESVLREVRTEIGEAALHLSRQEEGASAFFDEVTRQFIVFHQKLAAVRRDVQDVKKVTTAWENERNVLTGPKTILDTSLWTTDASEPIRTALRLLQPMQALGQKKIRLGREFDGGYVQLDDFDGVVAALSLGINDDDSWDTDVARRGLHVYQYDHTIDAPPHTGPEMTFHRRRIASKTDGEDISINDVLRELTPGPFVIKMDIESDEWDVLENLEVNLLDSCRQFICEFHELNKLYEDAFRERAVRCWRKMAEPFFVCHVHANNCGNIFNVGNVTVPGSLEVTFANRRTYEAADGAEIFPTAIDMPNQAGRADIFLGSFKF